MGAAGFEPATSRVWHEPLHSQEDPREPAPDEAEKSERSDARGANTMVAATIIIVLTTAVVVLVL